MHKIRLRGSQYTSSGPWDPGSTERCCWERLARLRQNDMWNMRWLWCQRTGMERRRGETMRRLSNCYGLWITRLEEYRDDNVVQLKSTGFGEPIVAFLLMVGELLKCLWSLFLIRKMWSRENSTTLLVPRDCRPWKNEQPLLEAAANKLVPRFVSVKLLKLGIFSNVYDCV